MSQKVYTALKYVITGETCHQKFSFSLVKEIKKICIMRVNGFENSENFLFFFDFFFSTKQIRTIICIAFSKYILKSHYYIIAILVYTHTALNCGN